MGYPCDAPPIMIYQTLQESVSSLLLKKPPKKQYRSILADSKNSDSSMIRPLLSAHAKTVNSPSYRVITRDKNAPNIPATLVNIFQAHQALETTCPAYESQLGLPIGPIPGDVNEKMKHKKRNKDQTVGSVP